MNDVSMEQRRTIKLTINDTMKKPSQVNSVNDQVLASEVAVQNVKEPERTQVDKTGLSSYLDTLILYASRKKLMKQKPLSSLKVLFQ